MAPSLRKRPTQVEENKLVTNVKIKTNVLKPSNNNNHQNNSPIPVKRTRLSSLKENHVTQPGKNKVSVSKKTQTKKKGEVLGIQKENSTPDKENQQNSLNDSYSMFKNIVFQSTLNESKINNEDFEISLLNHQKVKKGIKKKTNTKDSADLENKKSNIVKPMARECTNKEHIFKEPLLKQTGIQDYFNEEKQKEAAEKVCTLTKTKRNRAKQEKYLKENKTKKNTDCFGFDVSDDNLQLPISNEKSKEDECKPWRCTFAEVLALIKKIELENILNSTSIVSNVSKVKEKTPVKKTVTINSQPQIIQKKKSNLVQKKLTEMSKKPVRKPQTRVRNKNTNYSEFYENKNDTSELFVKELGTPGRNKPARRSYERRFKETEVVEEPSTEEVLLEISKKKQTRPAKKIKEDKELEEWSKSINCMFDEVEKFELNVD